LQAGSDAASGVAADAHGDTDLCALDMVRIGKVDGTRIPTRFRDGSAVFEYGYSEDENINKSERLILRLPVRTGLKNYVLHTSTFVTLHLRIIVRRSPNACAGAEVR